MSALGYGLAAAGAVGAAGANLYSQASLNKANRAWQEKMYARQLADERENWNMQNEYNEAMYLKYNSPDAQARQMMSAGLNPDLQDISANGLPASGAVGSASVPSPSGSPLDFVGAFANVMDIVQGLESSRLDNQLKKAELDKLTKSTAMDYLVKTYNPRLFDSGLAVDVPQVSKSKLESYFRGQGLSRNAARQAARYVRTANLNDVKSEYYRRGHSAESERKSYLSDIADPFHSDFDDTMVDTLNDFFKVQSDLSSWIQKSQKAKARYDANYWNGRRSDQDAQNDSDLKGYQTGMAKQSFESGQNESAIDAQAEEWLSKIDNPIVQLIARFLFMKGKNFSFSGAGFRI